MVIRQQDIVWVKFPFSDMGESKFRPAIVISNNDYNEKQNDVLLCAITSKIDKKEYGIIMSEKYIESGYLPIKSMIRTDKIVRIEKSLIGGKIARIDDKTFDSLIKEIIRLIKRR